MRHRLIFTLGDPAAPHREFKCYRPVGSRSALTLGVLLALGCRESAASFAERALNQAQIDATIDSLVESEALRRGVPGLAVVVVSRGRVVVQRAYGTRDIDSRLPVTLATPFNIASLTKPFTALATLRLAAQGKLDLDAPARHYLASLPARYESVTVRQLLTHTSGVARDLRSDNLDDPSAEEYRRRLDSASASAPPGTRWEYSNAGYTILGWVIEAVAGQPLGDVLDQRIFAPLDMQQATYRTPLAGNKERAAPHAVVDGRARKTQYVTGGFGSGGVILSGADLARFSEALQEVRVLDADGEKLAWTPARLANNQTPRFRMFVDSATYGMGWFITVFEGERLLTHGGAIEGFSSNFYHFPDVRLTIAIVANAKARDDGKAPVDPLAQSIASYCLSRDACWPGEPDTLRNARDSLASANREFSRAYISGDTARIRSAYTSDAIALPPSGRIVNGRAAIGILFNPPPRERRHRSHALYTERLHITGETALEAGTWYDVWGGEQNGEVSRSSGRYALAWRREGGAWRIAADTWWAPPSR